jgi:hypothetical protein
MRNNLFKAMKVDGDFSLSHLFFDVGNGI